jgi:hypothetical protein
MSNPSRAIRLAAAVVLIVSFTAVFGPAAEHHTALASHGRLVSQVPATGSLKVCKVLTSETIVPPGTLFTFSVSGQGTVSVAPGTCAVLPGMAPGSTTVTETGPSGYTVTAITFAGGTGTANLAARSATAVIAPQQVTEVTFTNDRPTGELKICKALAPGTTVPPGTVFTYTVSGNSYTVTPGTCNVIGLFPAGSVTITETGPAGYTVTAITFVGGTGTANVAAGSATATIVGGRVNEVHFTNASAVITVAGQPFTVPEGTTSTVTVATFTGTSSHPCSDFTATINWGGATGGSTSTTGTITGTDSGTGCTVTGTVAYLEDGSYTVTTTVTYTPTGATRTGTATASVTEQNVSVTNSPDPQSCTMSTPCAITFTFFDPRSSGVPCSPSTFTATINPGDGTGSQAATVSAPVRLPSGPCEYQVTLSHTYATPGSFTATVTIFDDGHQVGTGSKTVNVARQQTTGVTGCTSVGTNASYNNPGWIDPTTGLYHTATFSFMDSAAYSSGTTTGPFSFHDYQSGLTVTGTIYALAVNQANQSTITLYGVGTTNTGTTVYFTITQTGTWRATVGGTTFGPYNPPGGTSSVTISFSTGQTYTQTYNAATTNPYAPKLGVTTTYVGCGAPV